MPDGERKAECYEIEPGQVVGCAECMRIGDSAKDYKRGEVVLLGMFDSPYSDGNAHYMCNQHLNMFFSADQIVRCDG